METRPAALDLCALIVDCSPLVGAQASDDVTPDLLPLHSDLDPLYELN